MPTPTFSSKKILMATFFGALLIALAVLSVRGKSVESMRDKGDTSPIGLINNASSKDNEIDSDGDGLKDWEESLWGTEVDNKDSDGDSTSDGEEINLSRDPLVPGPNDFFADKEAIQKIRQEAVHEDITPTVRFSRELFAKYLLFKQSGAPLSDSVRDQLIEGTIADTKIPVDYKTWNASELQLQENATAEDIHALGNHLGRIVRENTPPNAVNELYILAKMVSEEDYSDTEILVSMANGYQKTAQDYSKLKIPKNAAGIHVALLNSLEKMSSVIRAFSKVESDPISTVVRAGEHDKILEELNTSIKNYAGYLKANNITYKQSEPGYSFTAIAH